MRGIPSLAVSISAYEDLNFEAAARLVTSLASKIKNGALPKEILLNINLPNLPPEEILGIEITELSRQSYCDAVEKDRDCEEACYRIRRNNKDKDSYYAALGTDIWALQQGKASITALFNSSVACASRTYLQSMVPSIFSDLRNSQKLNCNVAAG